MYFAGPYSNAADLTKAAKQTCLKYLAGDQTVGFKVLNRSKIIFSHTAQSIREMSLNLTGNDAANLQQAAILHSRPQDRMNYGS